MVVGQVLIEVQGHSSKFTATGKEMLLKVVGETSNVGFLIPEMMDDKIVTLSHVSGC